MDTGTTQETTATAAETTQTAAAASTTTEAPVKADAPKEEPKGSMVTVEAEAPKPEDKGKDPAEKPAVPEKYELKLPQGSQLEPSYLEKVASLAKEKGWSNARAQEYIDDRHAAVAEYQTKQQADLQTLNLKTWKEELMADPDFGGKNFEVSGHLAYKAAERFGGKEFAEVLKTSQLNHHPQLFRFLVRVGKAMESDTFVESKNTSPGRGTQEDKLRAAYPSMFKTKE